jgi:hypothetical protein
MYLFQDRGTVQVYLKTHYPVILNRTFNLIFLNEVLKKNSKNLMQKSAGNIVDKVSENSIF